MDTIILLLLLALIVLSGYLVYLQTPTNKKSSHDYIDALERQIRENNRDITRLSANLNDAIKQLAIGESGFTGKDATSEDNPLQQISLLESKLRERERQISWLHIEIAKFQKQKAVLAQREAQLNKLSEELASTRTELAEALKRLSQKS